MKSIKITTTQEDITADKKRINDYINTPGKLPMSVFRPKLKFNINRGLSGYDIEELAKDGDWCKLDFDVYLPSKGMNLQRDFVWTIEQKRELIISVLKGIRIPPVTFVQHIESEDRKLRILQVIDGKQRISTLISFYRNEFPILYDGKEYFFKDLTDECQREIDGCLRCDVGYSYWDTPITDEEKITWFELINFTGTPQDEEHMNKLKGK